jgi:histidyl-tRNA synthetase
MITSAFKADDVLKRAAAIGSYYGFTPLTAFTAKKGVSRAPFPENIDKKTYDPSAQELLDFLKHVRDTGIAPSSSQPLFVWHTNAAAGRPAPKNIVIQFHALGTDRAIADATLMRAVRAFMQDLAKSELTLRINSMGDKETRSRYVRELSQFTRKQGHLLPTDYLERAKTGDVFGACMGLCKSQYAGMLPSSTDHLSEASRKHFECVIEYLEASETPYELAPELLSHGNAWAETCFEINGGHALRAWGSRYNEVTKPFFRSTVSGAGAVIRVTAEAREPVSTMKTHGAPRFVFVHIGDEAKRESMRMADTLRKARIPLTQSIGIESLTEQMRQAETLNPPYLLIMGRKEALERSVILRHRASYTETFIPLDSLVEKLKEVS